jgi:N-acetylglucosamine kinase
MILALDIGGSRIKAAVWDGALRPLGEVATPVGRYWRHSRGRLRGS